MSTRVTGHAVLRYRERVAPEASSHEAVATISAIVESGGRRPKPRRWCRPVSPRAAARYVYSASFPGICVVLKGDAAITVFSRRVCALWRQSEAGARTSAQW